MFCFKIVEVLFLFSYCKNPLVSLWILPQWIFLFFSLFLSSPKIFYWKRKPYALYKRLYLSLLFYNNISIRYYNLESIFCFLYMLVLKSLEFKKQIYLHSDECPPSLLSQSFDRFLIKPLSGIMNRTPDYLYEYLV